MLTSYFMIKNRDTGEFITSTNWSPSWGKKGKIWKQRNHVTAHINIRKDWYENKNIELVEYQLNPIEIAATPVRDVITKSIERKEHQAEVRRKAWEKLEYNRAKQIVDNYKKPT